MTYEDMVSYDTTGKYKKVKCPGCKSGSKTKLANSIRAIVFTNPRGTSKADSFTYVAGHNMEQAKGERRAAESRSHVGASPYNDINDLDRNGVFGEVQ